ncbi:MAG: hypothetical protein H6887_08795 [Hoeflea sp.]|jgi:hypothetical protein|nr:hypothetical protein [Hoeflea sp.]
MQPKKETPEALAGAVRGDIAKTIAAVSDNSEANADGLSFQAAYVAQRYGLSPCMARLVCQLAQIGGRLA